MKTLAVLLAYASLALCVFLLPRYGTAVQKVARILHRLLFKPINALTLLSTCLVLESIFSDRSSQSFGDLVLPVGSLLFLLFRGLRISFSFSPVASKGGLFVAATTFTLFGLALGFDSSLDTAVLSLSLFAVLFTMVCGTWLSENKSLSQKILQGKTGRLPTFLLAGLLVALFVRSVLSTPETLPETGIARAARDLPTAEDVVWFAEAEDLPVESKSEVSPQDMKQFPGTWSGSRQLLVDLRGPGQVEVHIDLPYSVSGTLLIRLTGAGDYGILEFSLDKRQFEARVDGYSESVVPLGWKRIGRVHLPMGEHLLRIRSEEKYLRSTGFKMGLDAFAIVQDRLPVRPPSSSESTGLSPQNSGRAGAGLPPLITQPSRDIESVDLDSI